MNFYSLVPYFIEMPLIILMASSVFFKSADSASTTSSGRNSNIDGLRGFLALAVFFHHSAITYLYHSQGRWTNPPSQFYNQLGQTGVSLFFMITGYLFWSQCIKKSGKLSFVSLYIGRIFRIGPLYIFAVIVMIFLVGVVTQFSAKEALIKILKTSVGWLCLGMKKGGEINGYAGTEHLTAGVTWTLRYEWMFYGSLIFTSFIARFAKFQIYITFAAYIALMIFASLKYNIDEIYAALFLTGMLCASINKLIDFPIIGNRIGSCAVLILAFINFTFLNGSYNVTSVFLNGAIFFLISSGCDIFGVLSLSASRRLGELSYGIYLLHGLVLSIFFMSPNFLYFSMQNPYCYWLSIFLCCVILLFVSLALHNILEMPGIDIGRKVSKVAEYKVHKGIEITKQLFTSILK